MSSEFTMAKGVRLKKNVIVYVCIVVGILVLFSARGFFLPKAVAAEGVRRDFDAKMAASKRHILASDAATPGLAKHPRMPGKAAVEFAERRGGLGQLRAPQRKDADRLSDQFKKPGAVGAYNAGQVAQLGQKAAIGKRPAGGIPVSFGSDLGSVKLRRSSNAPSSLAQSTSRVKTTLRPAVLGNSELKQDKEQGQDVINNHWLNKEAKQGAGLSNNPWKQFREQQHANLGPAQQVQHANLGQAQQVQQANLGQAQQVQGIGINSAKQPVTKGSLGTHGSLGTQGAQSAPASNPLSGMRFYDGSGNLVTSQPNWIVVTSIQGPTADVKALSQVPGWKLIVIGDTKTPKDWKCPNAVYLSVEDQNMLKLKILQYIPYKSYARKNIGYFFAITHGAKMIYDTDDDNKPNDGFRSFNLEDGETSTVLVVKNFNKTYNPYPHFGQHTIWPRGFPLDEVSNTQPREYMLCEMTTPYLRQGVVNGDPDVDAIYRLMRKHTSKRINLLFDEHAPRVALPPKVFAPYNSQNTISTYKAFWGLAFPVTLDLRVCDIWRSYWAQRLMWMIGGQVGFYTAGTFQYRSAHSYLKDFKDEKQLYYQASDLVRFLDGWKCQDSDFFGCIKALSYDMAAKGFWAMKDAQFSEAFLQDLLSVGYKPPKMDPIDMQRCKNMPSNVIFYPQEQAASYGVVPEYYLPPFAQAKFNSLASILKSNCPRTGTPSMDLSLNGSSLINNILLIIHLDTTPSTDLLVRLELFYRPRFGQILYCGKWQEQTKGVFHTMRSSFAEISKSAVDPQMACLYKAADLHYIVDGYLVIHQNILLNLAQLNKNKRSVWMPANWAAEGSCQEASCIKYKMDLDKASSVFGPAKRGAQHISSCNLYKPGASVTYNKKRVFYIPSTYNTHLRKASQNSVDGLSMAGWLQCVNDNPVALNSAADLTHASQATDYVQKFDFSMKNLCPVLGYNP